MKPGYILAIDQGTTGSRAILYNRHGHAVASAYTEIRQYYPRPGWVEHDPLEIWSSVLHVTSAVLRRTSIPASQIAGLGITNQRETTVLWDRETGRPLHRAIVWQDRRTSDWTDRIRASGQEPVLRRKTGLVSDPYFSATKIRWLLDQKSAWRRQAVKGRICFGTIDSWLIWNLTGGQVHATDYTNASRTLLFNIRSRKWDPSLLQMLKVPGGLLPEVKKSGSLFGVTFKNHVFAAGIPILSVLGDQQSALYGQGAHRPGQVKSTFGTGCFVLMNIGEKFRKPPFGLLTTLASDKNGAPVYAFEGAAFIAGAAIQWLRDGLGILKNAADSERWARRVKDCGGVRIIPAFSGLGSPYWEPRVRGAIFGIDRGTRREHLIRATLEALAHQNADIVECMKKDAGHAVRELRVDGGATSNALLMQFAADTLQMPVRVSAIRESTAWGAARLAGVKAGLWGHAPLKDEGRALCVHPAVSRPKALRERVAWKRAVEDLRATCR